MHQECTKSIVALTILVLSSLVSTIARSDQLPLEQAPSGNFYVDADFGGALNTAMLLDTGSGYVGLTKRTFKRLQANTGDAGAPEFRRKITGVMANGRATSVSVYTLPELRFGSCVLRDVEAVVFPRADRDILGLSALKRMQPFTLDLEDGLLTTSRCD